MKIEGNPTPKELIRCAFSYLEKASRSGPDSASHIENAGRILNCLRNRFGKEAEILGKRLHEALSEQVRLAERASVGKTEPTLANEQNRELVSKIASLRHEITELNDVISAGSAANIGGFIDLSLEEYETALSDFEKTELTQSGHSQRKQATGKRKGLFSALVYEEPTFHGIQYKPTPLGIAAWIVCLTIAFAASFIFLGLIRLGSSMEMDVARADSPTAPILITVRNNGHKSVRLFVPLPEGGVSDLSSDDEARDYGLRAWVREQGKKEYRLLPASMDCWTQDKPTPDDALPRTAEPRIPIQASLEVSKIRSLDGVPTESLRVALVRSDGAVLVSHDISIVGSR